MKLFLFSHPPVSLMPDLTKCMVIDLFRFSLISFSCLSFVCLFVLFELDDNVVSLNQSKKEM